MSAQHISEGHLQFITRAHIRVLHGTGKQAARDAQGGGADPAAAGRSTGVSQPAISQLENGTLEMSFSWARTFARVLAARSST
jgi:hypothetical protein